MPYLNNSFGVASASPWGRDLRVCGGVCVSEVTPGFSGVAWASPWLRASPGLIISGFVSRPSMMSSSRLEETSLPGYHPSRPRYPPSRTPMRIPMQSRDFSWFDPSVAILLLHRSMFTQL